MRAPVSRSLAAALLIGVVPVAPFALAASCTQRSEGARTRPPQHAEEPRLALLPARPGGWPFWTQVAFTRDPPRPSSLTALPLDAASVARPGAADARWKAGAASMREQILATGSSTVAREPRPLALGDFYLAQVCEGMPSLVTVDAVVAITFLVLETSLADAEAQVSAPAMKSLLLRLDARLSAAEPGAQPDLVAGLHVAEGVVAVGLSLMDATYVAPDEVKAGVAAELGLVRAHAGVAPSPTLKSSIDYTAFARRGAVTDATSGVYLAAQWLAAASFGFGAGESSSHVDMGAARARTRAALLIARLFMHSDADVAARTALLEIDRLGDLAFGEPGGASPIALARFSLERAFDLHDANAIGDPTLLDRLRRSADTSLGSMELVPLRRTLDANVPLQGTDAGVTPLLAPDIASWLASPSWPRAAETRHACFYSSALDALAAWLAHSSADGSQVATTGAAWEQRKRDGVLAAWALLRHDSVPFARVLARRPDRTQLSPPTPPAHQCPDATTLIVVEPHPEAIAALLGLVRQVKAGLASLHALRDDAPSRALLTDVEALLEIVLTAAEEEATGPTVFTDRAAELATVPSRLASIEARIAPAGGPFVARVLSDPARHRVLSVGTAGLDTLYVVVPDPRTGRLVLTAGATLARVERWEAASADATDSGWATSLLPAPTLHATPAFPATLPAK